MKWIKVSDKLPPLGKIVVGLMEQYTGDYYYDCVVHRKDDSNNDVFYSIGGRYAVEGIKYWSIIDPLSGIDVDDVE